MNRSKLVRVATSVALSLGLAASMAVTLGAEASHNTAMSFPNNLLPNSSFEFGVADKTDLLPVPNLIVSDHDPQYINSQPLLPQGWTFEGVAGLFDHSQNDRHTGRRMAAISIPAGGKRKYCDPVALQICPDSPANIVKDLANRHYSINPAWRTLNPVLVSAGTSYNFRGYAKRDWITLGEGAFAAVRWLNSAGQGIGYQVLAENRSNISEFTDWAHVAGSAVAPAGATQAHILLGATDDIWVGQVRWDDVCFGGCY